ncbi:MAG: hypothetical protein HKN30_14305 [Sulfitobacter sp.]|nr:hypothetical protein [Sulfitobacter sp.]
MRDLCRKWARLSRHKDFVEDEEGAIAIEAAIILPMMFWSYLTVFAIFDSFHIYSLNQKAAYTIGDAISRETLPIDDAYLTGAWQMFDYLSHANGVTGIRVTSIVYDGTSDQHYVDWSEGRGYGSTSLTNSDIDDWETKLPTMVDGERINVVETWNRFEPAFKTGLERVWMREFVFTRPRYAPRVCWEICN